ncbi:FHA domain-containing protein [Streptomyces sp. NPDC005805]|uniref:FHA domain-containing protein n=1 Tax=Streptomyces sp. NPDC005805 TaxID=3157068 RepID=UPI0033C2AA8D
MQIRLTVLAPRGGQSAPAGRACDVLVTAPAGTALAAVASGLASAVAGPDASGAVVLYAGRERLDLQRSTLGEPPLLDGAVLCLNAPAEDEPHALEIPAELHVVAGPDAGGVHLLHGGRISVGRSADADVPLDDPDVSRLHCEVTVTDDGRVTVADLGSTNGTTLDGAPVGTRPVRLGAGALLRVGESTLRLTASGRGTPLPTAADGEGHLRVLRAPAVPDPGAPGARVPAQYAPGAAGPGVQPTPAGQGTAVPGAAGGSRPGQDPAGTTPRAGFGPGATETGRSAGPPPLGDPGDRTGRHGPAVPRAEGGAWPGQDAGGGAAGTAPRAGFPAPRQADPGSGPGVAEAGGRTGRHGTAGSADSAGPLPGQGDGPAGGASRSGSAAGDPAMGGRPGHGQYGTPGAGGSHGSGPSGQGSGGPGTHGTDGLSGPGGSGTEPRASLRGGAHGQGPGAGAHGGFASSAQLPRWARTADPGGAPEQGGGRAGATPQEGFTPPGAPEGHAGRAPGRARPGSAGGDPHATHHPGQPGPHPDGTPDWARPADGDAPGAAAGAPDQGHAPGRAAPRVARPAGGGAPGAEADAPYVNHPAPGRGNGAPGQRRGPGDPAPGAEADAPRVNHPADDPAPGGGNGTPARRRRGIGAWARRLAGGREERGGAEAVAAPVVAEGGGGGVERWPDPAAVLLTALGPGPRLWERDGGHPESLVLRLGTADRAELPSVPVTVALREAGSLGLAGPRARLAGLARAVVAQLAALHSPAELEIVLISTDRARTTEERRAEWAWLGWLPQVRPAHGQDCRLLLAFDRDQAEARTAELTRRLDDGPLGLGWPSADPAAVAEAAARHTGPRTVVVVDGDPGSAALRETTARLAGAGPAAGVHLVCLAETAAASPLSPVAATYESACQVSLPFRECGAVALLSGDVATALRVLRVAGGRTAGHGTVGAVDAVSPAWAERFGRALAPLRTEGPAAAHPGRASALPRTARLLDELGLARATPASLMARWASAGDGTVVLGAGPHGPLTVDLTAEDPHLLIEGPPGSGRTELLRSVAASLAAGARPDRLGLLLVDGAGGERGDGLSACTELPHVTEHLVASDPVRMRAFAQALGGELKRRAELLEGTDFADWHARGTGSEGHRTAGERHGTPTRHPGAPAGQPGTVAEHLVSPRTAPEAAARPAAAPDGAAERGELHAPPSRTLRLRPGGRTRPPGPGPLPRLVVLVDDFDALVAPALGSPGRPAAGSVVRALEAVARDGERLGVHLVATSSRPDRTADTHLAEGARLRVVLQAAPVAPGPDDPAPGRGRLGHPDGRVTAFQGGRVTGRIPRTATLRPTVVPLEWERMGDPPARRPVRELGNGPTDLALLASALERAARSVAAESLPPLTPARP